MKNGRPYYYVREMARVDGKPKVVNQVYLGTPERIRALALGKSIECKKIAAQNFGALWLASLIDGEVGAATLIDSVIPRGRKELGPTVGEYFLYAVFNRMVDSCSKRALPDWYRGTAIQSIRPVEIDELDSQHFWEKWERVSEKDIEQIASLFFKKIARIEKPATGCFLFDTTNYYTYMASKTQSELAARGKNKQGKDWLRQVGVALLVSRGSEIHLFYREYEGNRHDSKVFSRLITEIVSVMKSTSSGELTVVFDKGMNSEDNIAAIDTMAGVHFITTYSPYYADDLVRIKPSQFKPVDSAKNRELEQIGREDDRLVAYRTSRELWGKERTVVVTYNPLTAAKQRYGFEKKLLEIHSFLFELRSKLHADAKWKDKVEKNYSELCEQFYLPKDLYQLSVEEGSGKNKGRLTLVFAKDHYRIGRYLERFGKNLLVTDHKDWSTDEIVRASLDRYMVEKSFRQTKDDDLVGILPLRHWTDGKIRCHLLTCIIALTYLRLIEIRLRRAGLEISSATAMEQMHKLHSCLCWENAKSKPIRMIEEPTENQAAIMGVFGYEVSEGVLQKKSV
ncbi:MAG: IS1634 family transposase [Syntrophobacteraceae bacterium]